MTRRPKKTPRVPELPDILYPEPVEFIRDKTFRYGEEDRIRGPGYVGDIGLDLLFSGATKLAMPPWQDKLRGSYDARIRERLTNSTTSDIVEKIFTVPADLRTAQFRLDVFDYLLGNKNGFGNFNMVFENLLSLIINTTENRSNLSGDNIWNYIANYDLIFNITENYSPFGEEAPEALQRMDAYFDALKKSHSHRKMGELAGKIKGAHDINLRIRVNPSERDFDGDFTPRVVSASVLKASEFEGEFGDNFLLDGRYEMRSDSHGRGRKPIKEVLERAIRLKYDRHFSDTAGHINATSKLFEPMLVYMGYLKFMREQEEKGVRFCRPKFTEDGIITEAKHPLVTTEPLVGNSVMYDAENSLKVLTGPNNGGKSVYVKTVGLIHALAQRGFYVPAQQASLRFVEQIHTHFIKPDDIGNAEGRYKNEMRRMNEIFDSVTPRDLIILDEPCGGTTLEAGEDVTRDFIKVFGELGSLVYLTTHMRGVANAVESNLIPRASNLHLEMESDGTPTYRLRAGVSPMDYGKFLPRKMGLDYETLRQRLAGKKSK